MSERAKGVSVGMSIDPIGEYLRFRERQFYGSPRAQESWREVIRRSLTFICRYPDVLEPIKGSGPSEHRLVSGCVNFVKQGDAAEPWPLGVVKLCAQITTEEIPIEIHTTGEKPATVRLAAVHAERTRVSIRAALDEDDTGHVLLSLSADGITQLGVGGVAPANPVHHNYFRRVVDGMYATALPADPVAARR